MKLTLEICKTLSFDSFTVNDLSVYLMKRIDVAEYIIRRWIRKGLIYKIDDENYRIFSTVYFELREKYEVEKNE